MVNSQNVRIAPRIIDPPASIIKMIPSPTRPAPAPVLGERT